MSKLSPKEALTVLEAAISGQPMDGSLISAATDTMLDQYERLLLTFTAGAGKVKSGRALAALNAMEIIEKKLFTQEAIDGIAKVETLMKLYQTANSVASESLEYIRGVIKLRPELEQLRVAAAAAGAPAALPAIPGAADDGGPVLPHLTPASRAKLRLLMNRGNE